MCACGGNCQGNKESNYTAPFGNFTSKEMFQLQTVRALDVVLIGPILIYASTLNAIPTWLRITLLLIGIGTIIYNGRNYFKTTS